MTDKTMNNTNEISNQEKKNCKQFEKVRIEGYKNDQGRVTFCCNLYELENFTTKEDTLWYKLKDRNINYCEIPSNEELLRLVKDLQEIRNN